MTSADDSPLADYSAMLRLDDRGFLVVGAGQGMGRQSAHAFAAQGARVLCVDIEPTLAKEVAEEVGGVACVADVRKGEDAERAVATAREAFGRLHGIADVVGMSRWATLADMPEEDWDWCHDMVVRHAYHLVKHGGPVLSADGGGSMVFVASISGISAAPFHGAYGAAKAALLSLVRTAAIELRGAGVRVNAVAPGSVATPRAAKAQGVSPEALSDGALTSMARTSDIASAILFLSCDLSRHITGQTLVVDGGEIVKFPYEMAGPPLPPGASMGQSEGWSRGPG